MSERYLLLLVLYAIGSFGAVLLIVEGVIRLLQPAILSFIERLRPSDAILAHVLMRVLPSLIAILLTWFSAVPGYLRGEPIGTHESPGLALWALVCVGSYALIAPAIRAFRLLRDTARKTRDWRAASVEQGSFADLPVVEMDVAKPVLVASGLLRASIFVSRPIRSLLSERELRAALRHEVAHCRQHHNLMKLVCASAPHVLHNRQFDERFWEVIEFAADDEACQVPGDALNLASAVVILAKQTRACAGAALYTPFIGAAESPSLERRVQRLVRPACHVVRSRFTQIAAVSGAVIAAAVMIGSLPVAQHGFRETLEMLVR